MAKKTLEKLIEESHFPISTLLEKKTKIIKLSPRMQEITGGIETGKMVLLSGLAKMGKSTLGIHIGAEAQAQHGMHFFYYDVEARLEPRNIVGCSGLDESASAMTHIRAPANDIYYAEQWLNLIQHRVKTEDNCVIMIDSLGAMASEDLAEDDLTRRYRSSLPNKMSNFIKIVRPIISYKNVVLVFVLHEHANQDPRSYVKRNQTGGNAIQYGADYNLRATSTKTWEEDDTPIGHLTNWKVIYSASSIKGQETVSKFRYGIGFDTVSETIDIACELGIISKKAGGNYSYGDIKFPKGITPTTQHLRENSKLFEEIKNEVLESL